MTAVRTFLQKSPQNVAVLRHDRAGLSRSEGSDWDIAVRDCGQARRDAVMSFGVPLIEVTRQYVELRFYRWGEVDFLPCFEFDGWEYLEHSRFWCRVTTGDDGIPRPCLAHDAFVAWFCGILQGGAFNDRYVDFIRQAIREDEDEFAHCLFWAFGRPWVDYLLDLGKCGRPGKACRDYKALRAALKWQSLKREGLGAVGPVAAHWWKEFTLHLSPPFPWIAFLGPDGSGKSTVIDGVKSFLAPLRLKVLHVHWRPTVRKPLDCIGPPATDPHHNRPRGLGLSIVALVLLMGRWWVGYVLRLVHRRSKSEIILSDRYYRDLLVDQRRYVYGGPVWLARWLFHFLPQPDFTFFLLTDAETIFARKAEVTKKELKRQLESYRTLAGSLGEKAVIIDVGPPEEEVIASVIEKMCRRFESRTLARLPSRVKKGESLL